MPEMKLSWDSARWKGRYTIYYLGIDRNGSVGRVYSLWVWRFQNDERPWDGVELDFKKI